MNKEKNNKNNAQMKKKILKKLWASKDPKRVYKNGTQGPTRGLRITLVLHSTGPRAGAKQSLSGSGPSVTERMGPEPD